MRVNEARFGMVYLGADNIQTRAFKKNVVGMLGIKDIPAASVPGATEYRLSSPRLVLAALHIDHIDVQVLCASEAAVNASRHANLMSRKRKQYITRHPLSAVT